jgi:hypothetical protein
MAETSRSRLDGIVSYWTFGHVSNASMEGFNNKTRWLIRQAYGIRDREYFKLKIYQPREINPEKSLWRFIRNCQRGNKHRFAADVRDPCNCSMMCVESYKQLRSS